MSKQHLMQATEDQHLRARLECGDAAPSDGSSSSSDSQASSGSSDAELDPDLGADLDQQVDNAIVQSANRQHMNSSLLTMYSSPAAVLPSSPSASDLVSQETSQSAAQLAETPAFAPLQVLLSSAAAMRHPCGHCMQS